MMYHFCTYFDVNYLARGLALYWSLRRHCEEFTLWVLCMDQECHSVLSEMLLPCMRLISLHDFEHGDDTLLQAKTNRNRIEYYFTCTPSLPLYVLDHSHDIPLVTYLDADLFFFSDPKPLFDEMESKSILVIEHRLAPAFEHLKNRGSFNVGFLAFRRDEQGVGCLRWWRERCIEWCYDRVEDGRFADQKYLDQWPRLFSQVAILKHKGGGLAPWNVANYRIQRHGNSVLVGGDPLIFYHFQYLKQESRHVYNPTLRTYNTPLSYMIRTALYRPYLTAVLEAGRNAQPYLRDKASTVASIRSKKEHSQRSYDSKSRVRMAVRALRRRMEYVYNFLRGDYLIVVGDMVW